jgi:hypothetical protein
MLEALADFLDAVRGRYRFVSLPDLLRAGRPVVQEWYG